MKNDLTFHRTTLSTTNDVINTLEYKMKSLETDGLPIKEGLADYMALSLDEIESQLQQLKAVKSEVADREKALKTQSEYIKVECVKFLENYGIEKLEGNIVSSVSIQKGKDAGTKKVFHTDLSKKEIEELVVNAGLGYYEPVETEATEPKLKVNKRRVITPEIEG